MNNKNQNQFGFAHVGSIVFILVLGIVTAAGLRVYAANLNSQTSINSNSTQTSTVAESKSFTFAAAGDFGSTANADAVLRKIGESKPAFTLGLGDLGYGAKGTEATWCEFVKQRVGTEHPFEIVSGNHDDGNGQASIMEYRKCLPDKIGGLTGDYGLEYYFDYNDLARFILISPDIDIYGYTYTKGSPHYDWLASVIDGAKVADIQWVILGMHKNCITPGEKVCEIGEDLLNLAIDKKVDLILQGHEHAYMRSKQLALSPNCPVVTVNAVNASCISGEGSKLFKGDGSVLVISGAGGYKLRPINLQDTEIGYFETWNGSNVGNTHGFSQFKVSNKAVKGSFVAANGTYSDSYSIISR